MLIKKIPNIFGAEIDLRVYKSKIILNANNMQEAVNIAYDCSKKGDAVLLSPACASFDLFDNYEDRGRQFKELVRKL